LVGDNNSTARSFVGTYCDYRTQVKTYNDFWNKKSDANITLEFSQPYYVQRYTGDLSTYPISGYDYDGRYAYTDFYERSQSHNFSLHARSLGPNLQGVSNNIWQINPFNCQYDVNNLIFPPAGDRNNIKYGYVAFMYRQVSLTNPFPNRAPGENWAGEVTDITRDGYKVYSNNPVYTINLTPGVMQGIRGYGTNYTSFYTNNPYRSIFVENYIRTGTIIKGR
jgi:hypothetical protein